MHPPASQPWVGVTTGRTDFVQATLSGRTGASPETAAPFA